jgi:excinuclease ABC subunit C
MTGPKPDITPKSLSPENVTPPDAAPQTESPEIEAAEDDDEASLPQPEPEPAEGDAGEGSLAAGRAAIIAHLKLAPSRPGVYRMIDQRGDVLYVGKAKNIKKRIAAYARPTGSTPASSAWSP